MTNSVISAKINNLDFIPEGVLFDMDGVIVDSQTSKNQSAIEIIYKHFNLTISAKWMYQNYNGMRFVDYLPNILANHGLEVNLTDEKIAKILLEKDALFAQKIQNNLRPIPGAINFIKALHQKGSKLAIASGSRKSFIEKVIKTFRIEEYFTALVSSDEVKNGKPAPDVYLEASKRIGVNATNCLVVEDAIVGMLAGQKAGCKVLGFVEDCKLNYPAEYLTDSFQKIMF